MKNKIILFSSLLFLLIILWIPAKFISNFIPEKSGVIVSGLKGSVWQGEIANLEVKGWSLNDITFDTQLLSLMTGKLGADIDISKGDLKGNFSFKLKDEKNIELSDANVSTQLSHFEKYIPFKGIELNGQLETKKLNFTLVDSKPTSILGSTLWNNGSVVFNGKSWELGYFDILWNTKENGTIEGEIKKAKNVLDIQGSIKISNQGLLEFTGSISTKVEKPIFNAFVFFADGKPSNGRQAIKFTKKIW